MNAVLINLVLFQLGWFVCVLGAAWGAPLAGPIFVAALTAVHITAMPHGANRAGETLLLAGAAGLGYAADSALVLGGLVSFPEVAALGRPSTVWMAAMWANFAMVLHVSLRWLRGRYLLGAVLGLLGGPASYYTGARLGAIELAGPTEGLVGVGVEWAIATPVLLVLAGWTGDGGSLAPTERPTRAVPPQRGES
jgi:hypothetical protein